MRLSIKLDILTKTKIINHCSSSPLNVPVNGQLLGIHSTSKGEEQEEETILEITDCYPIPSNSEDSSVEFQLNVLKHLREVNSDYTTIGFYQSASSINQQLIDNMILYQKEMSHSVVLLYTPSSGELVALRLRREFIELYESNQKRITMELVKRLYIQSERDLLFDCVFERVEILNHDTSLVQLFGISKSKSKITDSTTTTLEESLLLMELLDSSINDNMRINRYFQSLHKQQQSIQYHLNKKKQNASEVKQIVEPKVDYYKQLQLEMHLSRFEEYIGVSGL